MNISDAKAMIENAGAGGRDAYASLARCAESADRFEDMINFMRELVLIDANLNEEERNLLSVAYKNVIGAKRQSWRQMQQAIIHDPNLSEMERKMTEVYIRQVEKELKAVCDNVLDLLEVHLVPASKDKATSGDTEKAAEGNEASVFYLKMAGDYCRYLAESSNEEQDKQKSAEYYGKASEIAKQHLPCTHPIRLGLALNYSVCFYEILKNQAEACKLAKTAFDDAISDLDKLGTHEYKDSTLIMQLLRDNLTLWTSNPGDGNGESDVEVEDISDAENDAA
mmetsp:Transcript_10464/g.15117  ORF Transcript_10464/g.15117 Transcript_10464/m.15117 type:complete len:281 (-) Transcript_10464:219-1061(-)|eukprot:CAMPEP_0175103022 /NCGR_PEP_ID=MMETSP0086_2-20121207/8815_1 /TAXON_ID=136419 /ORGANISM="Unknown Unknown, Strain D1" /LENGTH=280 /DNA_ID=CAMNT_0016378005 /DNA_START=24 /DNA_END=866 /DNA_ORIENTATION=-